MHLQREVAEGGRPQQQHERDQVLEFLSAQTQVQPDTSRRALVDVLDQLLRHAVGRVFEGVRARRLYGVPQLKCRLRENKQWRRV